MISIRFCIIMVVTPITFFARKSVKYGEGVYIVGNTPELGNWNPQNAQKLFWKPGDNWSQKINFTCTKLPKLIEYKLVVMSYSEADPYTAIWQQGENSIIVIEQNPIKDLDELSDLSEEDSEDHYKYLKIDPKVKYNVDFKEKHYEISDSDEDSIFGNTEDKLVKLSPSKFKNESKPNLEIIQKKATQFLTPVPKSKKLEIKYPLKENNILKSEKTISLNNKKVKNKFLPLQFDSTFRKVVSKDYEDYKMRLSLNQSHSNHSPTPIELKNYKNQFPKKSSKENLLNLGRVRSLSAEVTQNLFSTYSESLQSKKRIGDSSFQIIQGTNPEIIGLQNLRENSIKRCKRELVRWMEYGLDEPSTPLCPIFYNFNLWEAVDGEVINQSSCLEKNKKESIITWVVLKSKVDKLTTLVINCHRGEKIVGGTDFIYGMITSLITKFYNLCDIKSMILFGDFSENLGDFELILNRFNIRPTDKGLNLINRVFSSDQIKIQHRTPEISIGELDKLLENEIDLSGEKFIDRFDQWEDKEDLTDEGDSSSFEMAL